LNNIITEVSCQK